MTIVVDTREQKPLVFGCDSIRKKLHVGDYGADFGEYRYPVVFERKSIADLFGTLTFGYDRFRKEINRAEKSMTQLIIAIEGTKEKVLKGYSHSAREPESIIKQLETIERKYNVAHMFFTSRISMANYIADFYQQKYEEYLNERVLVPKV